MKHHCRECGKVFSDFLSESGRPFPGEPDEVFFSRSGKEEPESGETEQTLCPRCRAKKRSAKRAETLV